MIQVEADAAKNLLTISYSQHVGSEEAKNAGERAKALLAGLRPGFRLLTDLNGLESMDVACAPHLDRQMDFFNKSGVAKVVRVIPDPHKDIGLNIMSLFHYRRRIPIVTVETMAEALKELAE